MTTYDGIESSITTIKKMALQGDAESQYKLGFCYKEGIGTPQNYKEAVNPYCSYRLRNSLFLRWRIFLRWF